MFLESLVETSTQAKNRRGWATLSSFLIETAVIAFLIVMPMFYTDVLPSLAYAGSTSLLLPASGDPGPPPTGEETIHHRPPTPPSDVNTRGELITPNTVPTTTWKPKPGEDVAPPGPVGTCVGCVPFGIGRPDQVNPTLRNMLERLPTVRPDVAPSGPVLMPSVIVEGMLIRRVQPIYPQLAITTRTQGPVVLHAIIGRDGVIRQLQVASGHPLLVPAAVDAIRQWRYRPYYLNKQAVEVETEITVNFVLNR